MLALRRPGLVLGRSRSTHETKWQAETMSLNLISDVVVFVSNRDSSKQINNSAKFSDAVHRLARSISYERVVIRQHRPATDRAFDAADASTFQLKNISEIQSAQLRDDVAVEV